MPLEVKNEIVPRLDEVGRERMLRLADELDRDAENATGLKFDMQHWGIIRDHEKPVSCGTTACAMGLAALSKIFEKEGLGYEVNNNQIYFTLNDHLISGDVAAAKLFNMPTRHADVLFTSFHDTGAGGERRMAQRLREYVAGKKIDREFGFGAFIEENISPESKHVGEMNELEDRIYRQVTVSLFSREELHGILDRVRERIDALPTVNVTEAQ